MMRDRIVNNFGLKILSLCLAFIVWLVIINTEDPVETKTFSGVEVQVLNESIITNDGKMYQLVNDTGYVDVTVVAPRSVVNRISKSDIQVSADILNLQLNSVIPLTVTIPAFEGKYKSAETFPKNVQINIEDIESIKLPITAELTGALRDGYFLEYMTVSPDYVTVSGPESVINTIDSAMVTASASGLSEDAELKGTLHFYDADKHMVDESALTTNIGDAGVYITAHVMETVELPINVRTVGTPREGYHLSSVTTEPAKASFTGKQEAFENITEILIDDIDISGSSSTVEMVVDLEDYLPEGIAADKDLNKILVTAVIEKTGTRTINYPVGSIVVNNAPVGYQVNYMGITEVPLVFKGSEEELENLRSSDIKVEIDLSSVKSASTYEVSLEVKVPDGVMLSENKRIRIKMVRDSK